MKNCNLHIIGSVSGECVSEPYMAARIADNFKRYKSAFL